MNSKQRKASGAPQVTVFENPGLKWTLGLPGERKTRMATTTKKKANAVKKKGGSKKRKKNPATASSSSTRKASTTRKPNPTKKVTKKRNPAKRAALRNPLPGLGDVSIQDWGVFALFAMATPTVANLLATQGSWANIGIQFGIAAVSAKFAPKSMRTAATFGAGGPAVVSLINRLTSNAIPNAINQYIGPLVPQRLIGNGSTAPAPGTNMAGYRRQVRRVHGQAIY